MFKLNVTNTIVRYFYSPSFFYYQKSTMTSIYLISKNLGLIMNAGWQEQIIDSQKEI